MTRHYSSHERRKQIVEAALELLATTPFDRITTRSVARTVGISQPALFRHFRTREQILEAVISHAREQLEELATSILADQTSPSKALQRLADGLVEQIQSNPGLPRLLFHDLASDPQDRLHPQLLHLIAMQKALVSELTRQAQASGEIPRSVEPKRAADFFMALIQGLLLQSSTETNRGAAHRIDSEFYDFWFAALRSGEPSGDAETEPSSVEKPSVALQLLDVRPLLESGSDPLESILEALDRLSETGALIVVAPFRPRPLLQLLTGRGYRVVDEEIEADTWRVCVQHGDAPQVTDLCDLPAPEPMEHVLQACGELEPGHSMLAHVPRTPRLLFPHLEERKLEFETLEEVDGSALLYVRRPS